MAAVDEGEPMTEKALRRVMGAGSWEGQRAVRALVRAPMATVQYPEV